MSKATVRIDRDEWYPVYFINSSGRLGTDVEVAEETLARWKSVFDAFEAVQDEMAEAEEAAQAQKVEPS